MKLMKWSLAIVASLLLVACGGGGGGGGGGGTADLSCQDAFSPEKVVAGEDCSPRAETICPVPNNQALSNDPLPCDGVTTTEHEVTVGNAKMTYLAIRPSSGGTDSTVLALHYLGAAAGRFSNVVRLSELAKARKTLVIVPQANSALLVGKRWPTSLGADLDTSVNLLKAVLSDAKSRFSASGNPVYVSGLSNGAVMAYLFACRATDQVKAVLAVSGELGKAALGSCAPTDAVGTVIVHGNGDPVTPYSGIPLIYASIPEIHAFFKQVNGCSGADASAQLPKTIDQMQVTIDYTAPCGDGRRNFLVTVENGGHNWPGGSSDDATIGGIGLLGLHTRNFDATLQGYDLMRSAAGDD